MSERFKINGEVKNCYPCAHLKKDREQYVCDARIALPEIKFVEECEWGPLLKLPQRGQDMSNHLDQIQGAWRKQGER